ncbi:hypothetical protein AAHA92_34066 [Salvia divinorum]|uniref:Uncharacterized protein n=1 Tax=Salvia divinorum TaxID=28513 RepID=A0ABD1FJQ6_SALDI
MAVRRGSRTQIPSPALHRHHSYQPEVARKYLRQHCPSPSVKSPKCCSGFADSTAAVSASRHVVAALANRNLLSPLSDIVCLLPSSTPASDALLM